MVDQTVPLSPRGANNNPGVDIMTYDILLAILCTFLWGSAFPGVKIGYELWKIPSGDVPSYILFAGVRFLIAGMLTLIITRILKLDKNLLNKQDTKQTYINTAFLKACIILSFFVTFFQYICFYIGLSNATGVNGSIINSSGTIFTVILAFIIYKTDKPNTITLLGCLLSFIGIIVINLRNIDAGATSILGSFSLQGEGLLVVAALSFAIGNIISKHYGAVYNPATLTGAQLGLGGLLLVIVGILLGGHLSTITIKGILLLAYLSILSAVTFSLWTMLLKRNKASKIAIFNFLTPLFGVLLSGLILRENILNIWVAVSLVLTCTGIVLMQKS